MYYAPHALYRKVEREERDELNRIISTDDGWVYVCDCRCDDNTTQRFEDENGRVYIPKYKIVCERAKITEGDYVQCRVKDPLNKGCRCSLKLRGEGRVLNAPQCNYLNYMTIYV